jgi:hypothetical protein
LFGRVLVSWYRISTGLLMPCGTPRISMLQ